jgi:hypothetical protein
MSEPPEPSLRTFLPSRNYVPQWFIVPSQPTPFQGRASFLKGSCTALFI